MGEENICKIEAELDTKELKFKSIKFSGNCNIENLTKFKELNND